MILSFKRWGAKTNPFLFISALVPPELCIKSSDARTQEKNETSPAAYPQQNWMHLFKSTENDLVHTLRPCSRAVRLLSWWS